VTAVELGAHLAAVLARKLPTVDVVIGSFENVDLAPGSFDAVVAASSYHWVPPEARMTRPAALLRPCGRSPKVALGDHRKSRRGIWVPRVVSLSAAPRLGFGGGGLGEGLVFA
jgi:Methyltransferase domain